MSMNSKIPFRKLWTWRVCRRLLVAVAVIATAYAVFVTEENWRCKRDWENYKRAKQAAGDWHEWDEFVPPPIPDEENVYAAPHIAAAFTRNSKDDFAEACQKKFNKALSNVTHTAHTDFPVAKFLFVFPGTAAPTNAIAEFNLADASFSEQVGRLIVDTIGPRCITPQDLELFIRSPESIRPAQVVVNTDRMPTTTELDKIFPNKGWPAATDVTSLQTEGNLVKLSLRVGSKGWCQAEDYLQASTANEPFYELVDNALQRPKIRMNGDYGIPFDINIPNFVMLRIVAQELAARAQCHLLQDQPEAAVRDLARMKQLERFSIEPNPMTLVSAMINVAIHGLYTEMIADGFRLDVWQDAQLAELQKQIGATDIMSPVQLALNMERVAINRSCDRWRTQPEEFVWLIAGMPTVHQGKQKISFQQRMVLLALRIVPTGWYYQNQLTHNQVADSMPLKAYSPNTRTILTTKDGGYLKTIEAMVADKWIYNKWSKNLLATLAIPNYTRAAKTAARNQTRLNLALIACALERYRIARGGYPETLDALKGEFLKEIPHDLIGGGPLKYRRTADGKFLLYSLGWNETDDGGKGLAGADGWQDVNAPDWIWTTR